MICQHIIISKKINAGRVNFIAVIVSIAKRVFFQSECVETEGKGLCTNKRSSDNGKNVRDENSCGRYQKWGVLRSAIAREEMQKQQEYQAKQQRDFEYNQQRQKDEIRRERKELEREIEKLNEARKALEHERWYSSLSVEERKKYDEEQARLKAEEKVRLQEKRIEAEYKKREDERKEARKKAIVKIILWVCALVHILPSCLLFVSAFILYIVVSVHLGASDSLVFWLYLVASCEKYIYT